MKKRGSTSTPTVALNPMNEPAETMNPSSIDSAASDEQRNENPICQHFSMPYHCFL
ncbi:hypothetical protein DCAR_0414634 [Daucus carota subsp. sativus]|uniref:Uncharacterized protein n=1 Tax=Daucus carota subsp. sativus TaxID=79200 RepID=A0A175YCT6_DAUCS|nr:hypothetical protein DCAR_0414634 [Daucus carota subsp. sativus]